MIFFLPPPQDDEESERLHSLLADIGDTIASTKSSNISAAETIKSKMAEFEASGALGRAVSDPVSIPASPVRRNVSQESDDMVEEYEEYADYEGESAIS